MKLLIVTQVVDIHHPILGFFHRWVEEFAKQCDHIHVICLQKGTYDFPQNVTVHSLGKEAGKGRLAYVLKFYSLIWQLRHEYDTVFVHMNQIYVILGAPFWRAFGKKVGLWYAHGAVTSSLKIAVRFAHFVFTSTEEGLRVATSKKVIVGQGIDTDIFRPAVKPRSDVLRLITVGRISQSKNLETLLQACSLIQKNGLNFVFKIVGVPITPQEVTYEIKIKKLVVDLGLESEVEWVGAISNHKLPQTLQQSDIFIHDGSTNSLDKTLLEGALCGCIVVSSNPAYKSVTQDIAPEYLYKQGDSASLASIVMGVDLNTGSAKRVGDLFSRQYSVSNLVSAIVSKYE